MDVFWSRKQSTINGDKKMAPPVPHYTHLKFINAVRKSPDEFADLLSDWLFEAKEKPKEWELQKAIIPCLIGRREVLEFN